MNWLFFALLAPAIYPVNVFIDKYLLESKVKNYLGMPVYTSIAGMLAGTTAWFLLGTPTLDWFEGLVVIIGGLLSSLALVFYFKALTKEESSSVILLFQITPLLTLLLAFLLLKETISSKQILGFILVLAASLGASLRIGKNIFQFSPALKLVFIYDVLWASGNILFRFVSSDAGFVPILAYVGWGFGLGGILMLLFSKEIKKAFFENIRWIGKGGTTVIFLNETIFIIARLMTYYAISLAPAAALVSILSSTQVFFGILYGVLLTIIFPAIFKEKISSQNLLKKSGLALLACGGIYLIGG